MSPRPAKAWLLRCGAIKSPVLIACLLLSCHNGSTPTEGGAGPFRAAANALASENLPVVRALQNRKKPGTLLVGIRGAMGATGRVLPGSAWQYAFADFEGGNDQRYSWFVFANGSVESYGPLTPLAPASQLDIEPLFQVDSDRAVELAAAHGGREYLERHPGAQMEIGYRHFGRVLECKLHYLDLSGGGAGCEIEIFLDGSSGQLLGKETSCLGR